jgi:hypothetical protein
MANQNIQYHELDYYEGRMYATKEIHDRLLAMNSAFFSVGEIKLLTKMPDKGHGYYFYNRGEVEWLIELEKRINGSS